MSSQKIMMLVFMFGIIVFSVECFRQNKIGINFQEVECWQHQIVFADVMKSSWKEWSFVLASNNDEVSNVNYSSVSFFPNGYPTQVPILNATNSTSGEKLPPLKPATMMFIGGDNTYYYGRYKIVLNGSGQIFFGVGSLGSSQSLSSPGTYYHDVPNPNNPKDPNDWGFYLRVDSSDPLDPINSIKIIIPNHNETEVFNRDFIALYKDFFYHARTVRMMKISYANERKTEFVVEWDDRTPIDFRTQTLETGISYELLIDLMNELNINLWLCLPHLCTDDCLHKMAAMIKQRLNPHLKVILEYSNEVWNPTFHAHNYCKYNFSGVADWYECYANRSVNAFRIFEEEFGLAEKHRIFKVLCGQRVISNSLDQIITYFKNNPIAIEKNITFDGICCDGYIGGSVPDGPAWTDFHAGKDLTEAVIVEYINQTIESSFIDNSGFQGHITLAQQNNVPLIAYEGGTHVVSWVHRDNKTFYDKLNKAQRSPPMIPILKRHFDNWFKMINDGGTTGLFTLFTNIDGDYPRGSMGFMLNMTDTNNPKWIAGKELVRKFARCYGVVYDDFQHVCSGHGECIGLDNCSCSIGYSGLNCSKWSCHGVSRNNTNEVCHGMGICQSMDHCVCFGDVVKQHSTLNCSCAENYYGEICGITTCGGAFSNISSTCTEKGICMEFNSCVFFSKGFSGRVIETFFVLMMIILFFHLLL